MNKPTPQLIDDTTLAFSEHTNNSEKGANESVFHCANSRKAVLHQIAFLCTKFISLLESRFSQDDHEFQAGLLFLHNYLQIIEQDLASAKTLDTAGSWSTLAVQQIGNHEAETAIARLIDSLDLSLIELQMVVLAGMAEEHEGFANLYSQLHPNRQPFPTPALLAQLVCKDGEERQAVSSCLYQSMLFKVPIVKLVGETPIFTRSMQIEPNFWYALNNANANFSNHQPVTITRCFAGLKQWLKSTPIIHATHCLENQLNALVLIQNADIYVGLNRALALLDKTNSNALAIHVTDKFSVMDFNQLACQCVLSASVPVLLCAAQQSQEHLSSEKLGSLNLGLLAQICPTVIICSVTSVNLVANTTMQIDLPIQRLEHSDAIAMWQKLLPEFADNAAQLASWFSLDPYLAQRRVDTWRSLELKNELCQHSSQEQEIVGLCKLIKHYSGAALPEGIKRVEPKLGWSDLVLPDNKIQQLKDAIERLNLQHKVLDEWQFLQNRRGAKGVRLLFSGIPGTGKTLSAEVIAKELQVDLLVVDLAAVVSKWVGETEKNLASVFRFAEQSQAVLLFDEADAIFGRRTEVNDSHDRYANLETAYLLTRLEAYDGLAILATNFRNNIDVAFIRRLDFIVDFREPSIPDREHLWRCHVPNTAPLNQDVNFTQLATLFPLVGGEIRNAAVAAAYYAAQQQQDIQQAHFIMAIRKEFEKTGKAFREVNLT